MSENTTDEAALSKKATQRVVKLIVDILKGAFQTFLAGTLITPYVAGNLRFQFMAVGLALCLFSAGTAVMLEYKWGDDKDE